jgi:hypothetical protein
MGWICAVASVLVALVLLAVWPARRRRAGYVLGLRLAGSASEPLWLQSPRELGRRTADDARRLGRAFERLGEATARAIRCRDWVAGRTPAELLAAERRELRELWWSFFEAMMAVDAIKQRYAAWYGVDYLRHPRLHSRAFALCFAALCLQVVAGHSLLRLLGSSTVLPAIFDEAMPELGLPAGTFRAVRAGLARARDLSLVPLGGEWFDRWIARYLRDRVGQRLTVLVQRARRDSEAALADGSVARTAANALETLKAGAFARWFPVQKAVAEWLGDTRLVPAERRLVTDAQLERLATQLEPGDILVVRRNWYLSNLGLPGFWPHAVLHLGTAAEIAKVFDADPEVARHFGRLSEQLARRYPEAWQALAARTPQGHARRVIEAVSEGVIVTSLEHACGADYVAALRPRLPRPALAHAIEVALGFFGRPYDFNFDFVTDDAIVCSELVMKSFEPSAHGPGLRVPYVRIAGRPTVSPNAMVRLFATERGRDDRQLDFVAFLDGRESESRAVEADADALAASGERPKWDLVQP